MNYGANYRLQNELNFAGYPSVFYDAGDTVSVGGYTDEAVYRDRIEAVGARTVQPLDLRIRMDHVSGTVYNVTIKIGNGISANNDPTIPTSAVGPIKVVLNVSTTFKAASIDPDSDDLYYQFDWGNNTLSSWVGPYSSGDSCSAVYAWTQKGDYDIKVRTKDVWATTTDWSPIHSISVGCCIADRGNANGGSDEGTLAGSVTVADLVFLVAFMFQGGAEPTCMEEADINGSGGAAPISVTDLVGLVAFMFQGGAPPAACP